MEDQRPTGQAERGQALPLFAVAFVAICGFAGLALDGARLYAEHARLQGAADAAALGAAHELRRGNRDYAASLLPAAAHDAALHGVSGGEAEIIVHHPPVSGQFASSERHVEVVVRTDLPTTFMAMFGVGRQPVRSRAVAGLIADKPPCLQVLAEGDPGAYAVEGEQPFEIGCEVRAEGGADPFAGLRMPECAGRSPASAQPSADGAETIYWPGCYDEPVAIRSGRFRLMPGIHVFRRGLQIEGGEVLGEGVTLLFPASSEQRGVVIGPKVRVALSAAGQGELAGMLMFAEAGGADVGALVERSAGSDLLGALYFPGRTLRWAPNPPSSSSWTQAVAERLVILEAPDGRAVATPPTDAAPSFAAVLVE